MISPDTERQMVEGNMGLVYTAVRRFLGRGAEQEDLVQIGSIGLVKAVRRFDEGFGVKFSTYAVPMIVGEIKRFLRDDNPIKISRSLKGLSQKGYGVASRLSAQLGREPTIGEIAAECECSAEELSEAFCAASAPVSIYDAASDEDSTMRIEKITASDIEGEIIDKVTISQMLKALTDKERRVIVLRYFRDMTQSAVAEVIGVSQVQVSRIEKKALAKMSREI